MKHNRSIIKSRAITPCYLKTLGDYEVMYQYLIGQQIKQASLFEEISEKLMIQEAFHQTIMDQLCFRLA